MPGLYGVIGAVLGPLCYVQGPILVKAAAYTGALVSQGLTWGF